MTKLISIALCSMLGFTPLHAAEPPAAAAPAVYSFGIGPQQGASELAKRWVPILQYLSEKSGYTLQFATAKDIPTFQGQMKEGRFDLAYLNPYFYTVFHDRAGYEAFADERDANTTGLIVVRKDSPMQSVAELNNQTLAFPAPSALAATMLPLAYLGEQKVHVTPKYVVSMDSVYSAVAKGYFPAGGGELHSFSTLAAEVRDQLRVLWTAELLPPLTFAAHPRVPKEVVAKLQKVMHEMDHDPQGAQLLKAMRFKGFDLAQDSDYDGMRKLELKMPVESSHAKN